MPNQLAVVRVLSEDVVGAQKWNPHRREYDGIPTAEYESIEEAMAAVLERVALAVDWDRLLAEASWRHGLVHDQADEDTSRGKDPRWKCPAGTFVCGDCLFHALLSPAIGGPRWQHEPDVLVTRSGLDWAQVVADGLAFRAVAS